MQDFERLDRSMAIAGRRKGVERGLARRPEQRGSRALRKDIGRAHRAQIADQPGESFVGDLDSIDVDDRLRETGGGEQGRQHRRLDPGMDVGDGDALDLVCSAHRVAQLGQCLAARQRAEEQAVGTQRRPDPRQRLRQVVDGVESRRGDAQIVGRWVGCQLVFDDRLARGRLGEARSGVANLDRTGELAEPRAPLRVGTTDQKRRSEASADQSEPVEAIVERSLVQEQFGPGSEGAIAAKRAQFQVEQVGPHPPLVRWRDARDKRSVVNGLIGTVARRALDFALPPRCAGCGTIVEDVHSFCADCWKQVEFLGEGGCSICGMPLAATDFATCAACLARPPRIARTRAAVTYDELSRSLALRLKYGRKVALAKTMARYMLPLVASDGADRLIVPVPLHRGRLWWRGFNQSALVARELAKGLGIPVAVAALRRVRRTPPLKGLSPLQRRKTVAGAFRVPNPAAVAGKTVILIDDVLTTGSTAEACARVLRRAGAVRIELVSWARVVRPSQLMR